MIEREFIPAGPLDVTDGALAAGHVRALMTDVGHLMQMMRAQAGVLDELREGQRDGRGELAAVAKELATLSGRLEALEETLGARIDLLEQAVTSLGVNLRDTKADLEGRVQRLEVAVAKLIKPLKRKRK